MTQAEAGKIIDRLMYGCTYHRFDEAGVQEEYQKALLRCHYDQMNKAVDIVLDNDSKNVPPISTLMKAYREGKGSPALVKNPEHCFICDDKGYILMTEPVKVGENPNTGKAVNLPYQFVLHCICPVGMAQAYNGRDCKEAEHRTPYRIPCVTEYFDTQVLEGMKKPRTPEVKRDIQLSGVGRKMPELKPYEREPVKRNEVEQGDAWEGED